MVAEMGAEMVAEMGAQELRLALFGQGLLHSRSPALHAALAAERGRALRYHLLDSTAEEFDDALAAACALGVHGASVTSPHKLLAAARCALLTPAASSLGAVNALRWRSGALEGHNTDLEGVRVTLRALARLCLLDGALPLAGKTAGVLGAGGAASAAAFAALDLGAARVVVVSRGAERGRAFVEWLSAAHPRGGEALVEWRPARSLSSAAPSLAGLPAPALELLALDALLLAAPPLPRDALSDALRGARLLLAPRALLFDLNYGPRAEESACWAERLGVARPDPLALLDLLSDLGAARGGVSALEEPAERGAWCDGALMLAAQGVAAFRWWLDLPPSAPLSLRGALRAILSTP